jgi:hypothetical protein
MGMGAGSRTKNPFLINWFILTQLRATIAKPFIKKNYFQIFINHRRQISTLPGIFYFSPHLRGDL